MGATLLEKAAPMFVRTSASTAAAPPAVLWEELDPAAHGKGTLRIAKILGIAPRPGERWQPPESCDLHLSIGRHCLYLQDLGASVVFDVETSMMRLRVRSGYPILQREDGTLYPDVSAHLPGPRTYVPIDVLKPGMPPVPSRPSAITDYAPRTFRKLFHAEH